LSRKSVTQLLAAVDRGEASAQGQLWSAIYDDLHLMARRQVADEPRGRTLQPTSLVHEAYFRLFGDQDVRWTSRRHFFAAAAQAMRRIRIDEARRRKRFKRGGGRQRVPLDDAAVVFDRDPAMVLAIDEALDRLQRVGPRHAEVVLLRYFAGLSVDETASALDLSPKTVSNEWRFARAWLYRELSKGDGTSRGEGRQG
jgi:RNA polymerase sigma factor (TIGR02999 family)